MLTRSDLFDSIIYSDSPYLVKGLGDKLKVTTICDVIETELKNYLRAITDLNFSAKFYLIQYSKETQKLYIFADKKITIGETKNLNYVSQKEPDIKAKISTAIENAFQAKENNNPDYVSIYEIATLVRKCYEDYGVTKYSGTKRLEEKLNNIFRNYDLLIRDFDYEKEELTIEFGRLLSSWNKVKFTKKNNDLCLVNSSPQYDYNKEMLLVEVGEEISTIYDELKGFGAFFNEASNDIKSVNSNFHIEINCNRVKLSIPSLNPNEKRRINIISSSTSEKFDYYYNSYDIIKLTKGREEELFKKIQIKIEDCPKWSQDLLAISRQKKSLSRTSHKKMIKLKERIFPWTQK